MNGSTSLPLGDATLAALPEGALLWPEAGLLAVADLHLGKAERMARRAGTLVPPYETAETLARLSNLIDRHAPAHVLCLGDSFDDLAAAAALDAVARLTLARLMAGRRWTWVLGNHDPGPADLGGETVAETRINGIAFRHIAAPGAPAPHGAGAGAGAGADWAEVSGHYHPKAGLRGLRRPAFVTDGRRLILPAFGTYTGGLDAADPAIAGLMGPGARAILTGPRMVALPLAAATRPRGGPPRAWRPG